MRILYLTHRFPPDHFRGTEVYTFELAQEMKKRGHEVLVVALRETEAGEISMVKDSYGDVPVARICKKLQPENFHGYFFDPEMDRLWTGILQQFQPEIVHATYFLGGLSLGMTEAAPAGKLFITITDYSPLCARGQLLDREFKPCPGPRQGLRCLNCLFDKNWLAKNPRLDRWAREYLPVGLSEIIKPVELSLLREKNGAVDKILGSAAAVIFAHPHTMQIFARNRIKIHNPQLLDFGVNFAPFLGHQKSASARLRIGFIGQILPHKGLDLLLDALAGIRDQAGFELLVYGSLTAPSERKYFESLNLNRLQNAQWLGTFDYARMNEVLQGIDLLVVPSRWAENCPLVPKYALLTGTRLLISDAPGILPRLDGENVEVFAMGDTEMLRQKINRLLESSGWKRRIEPRRDLVMNIKEHADALLQIYRENG
jgi:glycosyltransferase involved in cell wall biosynthesis